MPRPLGRVRAVIAGSQVHAPAQLYGHHNFAARSLGVAREVGNFATIGSNDIASSLLIRNGGWLLCGDAGFQGACVTLGPGRSPSLRTMGLDGQFS